MKTRIIILSLFCLCACSKEPGPVSLKAGIPCMDTKTSLGESSGGIFPLFWTEGDVISVNGSLSEPLASVFSGLSEAEFRVVDASLSAPYHLLYPAESGVSSSLTFDGLVPPMYASGEELSDAFSFHQASFGLRISLGGNLPLSSLRFEAAGGEALVGSFALSFSDGSLTPLSASPVFTKSFPEPETLSQGRTYTFYFSPGLFSEGIVIRASTQFGESRSWLFASGRSLQRGKMYILPPLSFVRSDGNIYAGLEEMTETEVQFEL